jgi:hypothetical protein
VTGVHRRGADRVSTPHADMSASADATGWFKSAGHDFFFNWPTWLLSSPLAPAGRDSTCQHAGPLASRIRRIRFLLIASGGHNGILILILALN